MNKNYFTFVNDICYAVSNYNSERCYNIVKNEIKSLAGADKGFINLILSSTGSSFKNYVLYVPVYEVSYTVTYTWDTKEETSDQIITTHHTNKVSDTKYFYNGCYNSLAVNQLNNCDKLYVVNDCSQFPEYNDSVYLSRSELESRTNNIIRQQAPTNSETFLNSMSFGKVIFVPIRIFEVNYQGARYDLYINEHNGEIHYTYPVDQQVLIETEKVQKTVLILKIVSIVATILLLVGSIVKGFVADNFWLTALSVILYIVIFVFLGKSCRKSGKQNIINYFGKYGVNKGKFIKSFIILDILSVILFVLSMILIK